MVVDGKSRVLVEVQSPILIILSLEKESVLTSDLRRRGVGASVCGAFLGKQIFPKLQILHGKCHNCGVFLHVEVISRKPGRVGSG